MLLALMTAASDSYTTWTVTLLILKWLLYSSTENKGTTSPKKLWIRTLLLSVDFLKSTKNLYLLHILIILSHKSDIWFYNIHKIYEVGALNWSGFVCETLLKLILQLTHKLFIYQPYKRSDGHIKTNYFSLFS